MVPIQLGPGPVNLLFLLERLSFFRDRNDSIKSQLEGLEFYIMLKVRALPSKGFLHTVQILQGLVSLLLTFQSLQGSPSLQTANLPMVIISFHGNLQPMMS